MNNFKTWFNTFVSEKQINTQHTFEIEQPGSIFGNHFVPFSVVREFLFDSIGAVEQAQVETQLVQIDFHNGDVMHFFNFIAEGLVNGFQS